jgi:anaerobic magnesium-protoporphyrin IX monomethyl ester cyclase
LKKSLNVLLINPPNWTEGKKPLGQFSLSTIPLGLGYIAAVLESAGFSTGILDMSVSDIQMDELERRLAQKNPDVVGITSMTCSYPHAVKVARAVKHWNQECSVVMGGVHATFMFEEILRKVPEIDAVVRYEGEYTMPEVADALDKKRGLDKVKGIAFRDGDRIVSTPLKPQIDNLDDLPYPAYHLLEPSVEEYIGNYGVRNFPIITTRGCPFGCIYCSTMAFHGRKYRTRSIARVLDELEYLIGKYRVNNVSFVDDNFTMQNDRVFKLCEGMADRKLAIDWGCSARVDQVSEELLKAMKEAGCKDIFFGIESVSQRVLDLVNKRFTVKQAKETVKKAEKAGIRTHCSFIIGLPGETARSLNKMMKFIDETKPTGRVLPNVLEVLPGTELIEKKEEYFAGHQALSDVNITQTQIGMLTKFYASNYGIKELIRIAPPNVKIE